MKAYKVGCITTECRVVLNKFKNKNKKEKQNGKEIHKKNWLKESEMDYQSSEQYQKVFRIINKTLK